MGRYRRFRRERRREAEVLRLQHKERRVCRQFLHRPRGLHRRDQPKRSNGGAPVTNRLIGLAGANFVSQSDDFAHNEGSLDCGVVVDNHAMNVIASHADDEVGFGDVFAFDPATFVFREVEATSRKRFNGVVGGRTAPAERSGRMHSRVHAALGQMMGKQTHRHWRPTGITGTDDQDFDCVILEARGPMRILRSTSAMSNEACRCRR